MLQASQKSDRRLERGFSLTELLVVIAIMGTLLTLATLNFHGWTLKSNLERQTVELLTDINSLRLNAIHAKQRRGLVLNPDSYVLKNYSSDNEGIFDGTIRKTAMVKYPLAPLGSGSYAGNHFIFDNRGLLSNSLGTTITASPVNTGANDCIVLSVGRANMGKITNGVCGF